MPHLSAGLSADLLPTQLPASVPEKSVDFPSVWVSAIHMGDWEGTFSS